MSTIHDGWKKPADKLTPVAKLTPATCATCKRPFIPERESETVCRRRKCVEWQERRAAA